MKKDRTYYFAYGSNLSISQMKVRCPSAKLIRKGQLKDYKLVFSKWSSKWHGAVADIIAAKNNCVWGLVYSLTFKDLHKLDGFEGYPFIYNRKLLSITGTSDLASDIWVYYLPHKFKLRSPAIKYLSILQEAAKTFGFPMSYRKMLCKVKSFESIQAKLLHETISNEYVQDIEDDQFNPLEFYQGDLFDEYEKGTS